MRVKQLKMRSFRGIGDLTLDFDETEPTVLIGSNGVGKSSILDCLAILLSEFTARVQNNLDFIRSFRETDISNKSVDLKCEIKLFLNDLQEVNWFRSVDRQTFKQGDAIIKDFNLLDPVIENILGESIKENIVNNDYQLLDDKLKSILRILYSKLTTREDLNILIEQTISSLQVDSEASISLFVYYPVNRAVIDLPLEISDNYSFNQFDAYEQALTGGKVNFKSFFEWFRSREDLENEERRDDPEYRNPQLEGVRQAIYSMLSNFSNLRVRRSPLRMTVNKHGQELIVNQLSDGEKCLLAMVGDLARRLAIANPSLPDPLQGSGVVLIDEIELHLHPKWQREIIPALTRTFPNCQFIVTTHSPQVVSHVKPEGIYILEATDTGVVAKRPESSYGRDSNSILEDLMGVPERPQQIKDSILELFRLIDEGNLEGARELRQQLATAIGADEPEFVKADVLIRRKEILNR